MEPRELAYDRRGEGEPLLLVHGLGHRRQAWSPLLDTLAAGHDVIALDLPGCGQSPPPDADERYDIPALVDLLARFCETLGLRGPHVVGNSLGGALGLELAGRGIARSVTALSPIGFLTPRETVAPRLLLRGLGAASHVPEPVRLAVADSAPGRAIATRMLRGSRKTSPGGARGVRFDATALSAGSPFLRLAPTVLDYAFDSAPVRCPVTVAWGDRDRILPARAGRRALARIPHAHQVTLLGCGHVPMADNPHAVAATILATTRSAGPDPSTAAR